MPWAPKAFGSASSSTFTSSFVADDPRYNLPVPQPQAPQEQQWDYKTAKVNQDGDPLPPNALGWRPDGSPDFGTGLDGWWKKAYYNIQNAYFKGWDKGEELVKDNQYKTDIVPRFTSSIEATKAIGGELLWGGLNLLGAPALYLEQAAGSLGLAARDISQGKEVGGDEYWKNNWEASRLAYSIIWDGFQGEGEKIRNEFTQRMMNGERPDLIAEDMSIRGVAHPWVEFAGQLIFDPLNADLFANWFGKGRKALSTAEEVKKAFAVIEDPNLARVIGDAAKGGDRLRATEAFQDALKAHQTTAGAVTEMIGRLSTPGYKSVKGLPARARAYMNLIPESRKLALSNRMGAVIDDIARRTGGDAGEILDIFDAMAKSLSDNAADAAEGFRHMTEFGNPSVIFSQAGNELTAVSARMIEKHGATWLDDLAKANTAGDAAAMLMNKLHGVLDELYPSADKLISAMDSVKAAAKTGEKVTPEVERLAQMGEKMSRADRVIAQMHSNAQKGLVGTLNKAFSNLYMNWAPGYAVRNGIQNSLQIFLDYGPAAWTKTADDWIAEADKLHGTHIAASGFEPATALVGAAKKQAPKGSGLLDALKEMFYSEGKLGIHARAASEVMETSGARRVVGYTYQKTFKDALEPMVRDLAKRPEFRDLPPDVWAHIQSEIFHNYGDVRAAMDAVRKSVQSGSINLFRNYNQIPKGLQEFFFTTGQNRQIQEVLNASTKEEALAAANAIFDRLEQAAKGAYLDAIPATPGDALSDTLKLAQEDGYVSDARGMLIEAQRHVANETIAVARNIYEAVTGELAQQGIRIPKEFGQNLPIMMEWGARTSDDLSAVRNAVVGTVKTITDANLPTKWEALKKVLPGLGETPAFKKDALDQIWDAYLNHYSPETWAAQREKVLGAMSDWLDQVESLGEFDPAHREALQEAIDLAEQWQNVSVGEMGLLVRHPDVILEGTRATKISEIAQRYGLASASYAGVPRDKYLLNIINKEFGVKFKSLNDPIDLAAANRALAKHTKQVELPLGKEIDRAALEAEQATLRAQVESAGYNATAEAKKALEPVTKRLGEIDETLNPVRDITALLPPYKDGTMPSYARMLMENDLAGARKAFLSYVDNNFGHLKTVAADPAIENKLKALIPELESRVNTVRTVSEQVSQHSRNFTLLNYGEKTYFDVASAYLMPYGFWYKGTYNNWIQRVVQNPAIFAGYSKYKQAMEETHAGLPDWWKQNIQVNNVLGIPLEHPLFFNLEATLNPLNGITGVDFNDPEKATNWWTYTLDQMNKFGPNTWTPLSVVTGLALRAQGQEEAGNAWVGRVIPQTALVKTWTGKELDPAVAYLMGGYDKYERRRIGRALSELVLNGKISQEQAIEADRTQQGQIWEQAAQLANSYRQGGQTMSTLFGAGFKARSEQDMMIDQFDSEWQRLMKTRTNMNPEDFKDQLAVLGQKYPFMDTVLISRKTGPARDLAYAYNVLGRLQPGDASDLLKLVGVNNDVVSRFYDSKGDMSSWTEGDRMRFMAAMVDLGAITKIPSTATKQEWNATRLLYTEMQGAVKKKFGEDIYNRIDDYYIASNAGNGDAFLETYPEVAQAMDEERAYKVNNQLLNTYYGGIDTIQQYYASEMRTQLTKKYGKNIYEQYYDYLDEVDPKKKKSLYTSQLKAFIAARKDLQDVVNKKTAAFASILPDAPEMPTGEAKSKTQEALAAQVNAPATVSSAELLGQMKPYLRQLVADYFQKGKDLPYAATQQLDFIGGNYDLTANEVLQIIGSGK